MVIVPICLCPNLLFHSICIYLAIAVIESTTLYSLYHDENKDLTVRIPSVRGSVLKMGMRILSSVNHFSPCASQFALL
jgi:hypothetical protein